MDLASRSAALRVIGLSLAVVLIVGVGALATVSLPSERTPPDRASTVTSSEAVPTELADAAGLDLSTASYGPADAQCPADATRIGATESPQAVLDAAVEGDVICFPARTYRLTTALQPTRGTTLFFERGAVLNGAAPVTAWERDGSHWIARNQDQHIEPPGARCGPNPAVCAYEDLFVDGKPLERVLDLAELRPGTFYFDKPGDTIHLADDPTGRNIEATVAETAIDAGGVQNVTVRNATIEKFGKHGIVASGGWLVADNEIRYVHSHGLRVFGNSRVEGNLIHHTGNMGIFADEGEGMVFERNQLHHNNYLGFDLWHAGATKITDSVGTVVRDNWSHHNTGDGWWFDWDNIDSVVEGNVFEHNTRYGFFYEASFDAYIAGNAFRRNGTKGSDDGAGVWITTSRNVDLTANVFDDNRMNSLVVVSTDRGASERYGRRELSNLHVHDNTFALTDGYVGVAFGSTDVYDPVANNRFTDNTYVVPDTRRAWWQWGTPGADDHMRFDWSEWNAAGQDRSGTIMRSDR